MVRREQSLSACNFIHWHEGTAESKPSLSDNDDDGGLKSAQWPDCGRLELLCGRCNEAATALNEPRLLRPGGKEWEELDEDSSVLLVNDYTLLENRNADLETPYHLWMLWSVADPERKMVLAV